MFHWNVSEEEEGHNILFSYHLFMGVNKLHADAAFITKTNVCVHL